MAIFLFYGEDQWSLQQKLKFWRSEFEKKYGGDTNLCVLTGKVTTANEIFQNASSLPFLAEKRFIIVKNFLGEANIEEQGHLSEMLEQIPDFTILVFAENGAPDRRTSLFKKISKIGKLMEFPQLTGTKLLAWIEKTAFRFGGTMEKEALLALSEISTGDLYHLENEVAKLAAYAHGRDITKRDVTLLTSAQTETSIFRLTDSIGQKNRAAALSNLHQVMESGEELHRILSMIMRQFRIIVSVKDLAEQGARSSEIAVKLKEHPFVVNNTLTQSKNFTREALLRAYKLLIEMDAKLKTGGIKVLAGDNREFVLAMDRLVLKLCV